MVVLLVLPITKKLNIITICYLIIFIYQIKKMFRLSTKCLRTLSSVSQSLPKYGAGSIFEITKGRKYMEIVTPALWSGPAYDGLGMANPDPEFCTEYIIHELNELVVYRIIEARDKSFINTANDVFVVTKEIFDEKMELQSSTIVTKNKMLNDILADGESESDDDPIPGRILIS
jgi:hypothetical protein